MAAYLEADPSSGPGYGIITVPGLAPRSAPLFALYRASDGQCLSTEGWQNSEAYLAPQAWDSDTGALRLAVNAQVVDHMDALDTYRLLVREEQGTPVSHTMLVKDIVYSSMHGGQGIVAGQSAPPPPPPAPEPEPEPELPPEPERTPPPHPVDMPDLVITPAPEQPKSKAPLFIGLLIVLLAAGGGMWWYMNKDKPAEAPAPTAASPAPAAAPAPAAQPPLSPLQQAREHLRAGGDSAQGWALAQTLLKDGTADKSAAHADAAFLLIEDAAQKKMGPAMLRLAAFYDPTDVAPKGSISPDAGEACAWYIRARDAGQSDAQTRLALLRAWAESQAAKGDAKAKALLEQWK